MRDRGTRGRLHVAPAHEADVAGQTQDPMRVVAGQIGVNERVANYFREIGGRAGSLQDVLRDAAKLVDRNDQHSFE
jgi:hypothetical protein